MHKGFTRVIELSPNDAEAYVARGRCYTSNDPAAFSDYQIASRINPSDGVAYKQRAYTYLRRDQFDKAEADIRKALQFLPMTRISSIVSAVCRTMRARPRREQMKIWQQSLSGIGRYHGPIDGECDDELIEIFAECAQDRCRL